MSDLAKELRELAGREEYLSATKLSHTKEGQVLVDAADEIERLTKAEAHQRNMAHLMLKEAERVGREYAKLAKAAKKVVDSWSEGDIAEAVDGLSCLLPEDNDAAS